MIQLYDYQERAKLKLRQNFMEGSRHQLLVGPTGSGKTTVFVDMLNGAAAQGLRGCVLAHRRELIDQASKRLDQFQTPHGVIMANHSRSAPHQAIQVASIDTLRNRRQWYGSVFDFIIIDEAHRSLSQGYIDFLAAHPEAWVVGCTATPYRLDGKPLGQLYEDVVTMCTTRELVERGILAKPRFFIPSRVDMTGVKISGYDYDQQQKAERLNNAARYGSLVTEWKKYAPGRKTIVFAGDVADSKRLCALASEAGIRAVHLDANSDDRERVDAPQRLERGEIDWIVNVGLFTEGTDFPFVDCIVLGNPTKSRSLYVQMVGRGLRGNYPGKHDCIVLDHSNLIDEHGLFLDDAEFDIHEGPVSRKKGAKRAEKLHTLCKKCLAANEKAAQFCAECGAPLYQDRVIEERKGELKEVTEEQERALAGKALKVAVGKAKTLEEFQEIARINGYKPGWAHVRWSLRNKGKNSHTPI